MFLSNVDWLVKTRTSFLKLALYVSFRSAALLPISYNRKMVSQPEKAVTGYFRGQVCTFKVMNTPHPVFLQACFFFRIRNKEDASLHQHENTAELEGLCPLR